MCNMPNVGRCRTCAEIPLVVHHSTELHASKGTCSADHAPQATDDQAPPLVPSKAAQLVSGQVPRACHLADGPPGIYAHSGSVVDGELTTATSRLPPQTHLTTRNKGPHLSRPALGHWQNSCMINCTVPACLSSFVLCVIPEPRPLGKTLHLCLQCSSCSYVLVSGRVMPSRLWAASSCQAWLLTG